MSTPLDIRTDSIIDEALFDQAVLPSSVLAPTLAPWSCDLRSHSPKLRRSKLMEQLLAPLIQVRLVWATHHAWKARQTLKFAAPATALWLVEEGEVEVGDNEDEHSWTLRTGQAFLWSAASNRRISTQSGATWLSLGLQVNFFDNLDMSRALDLPVQWQPTSAEWQTLQSCTREIVRQWHGGEEVLINAASIAAYTREMDARQANRSPLDVMVADSLARAVFGLCWKRLAGAEAAELIEKRIPQWLSETLQRVHRVTLIPINPYCIRVCVAIMFINLTQYGEVRSQDQGFVI